MASSKFLQRPAGPECRDTGRAGSVSIKVTRDKKGKRETQEEKGPGFHAEFQSFSLSFLCSH